MSRCEKVTLSVNGRFHAFDFARALDQRRALHGLLTSYPAGAASRMAEIPREKVQSLVWPEVLRRAHHFLPLGNPQYFLNSSFDKWAGRHLPEGTEVLIAWSGNSLVTLEQAKARGIATYLERHSAHIETQTDWLREEYRRFGLTFRGTHPKMIEQEMREYQLADWISVPSQFVKRTFLEKGFSEAKIRVHPLAVDTLHFKPTIKNGARTRFFYGGQLSLRKGIPYLLEAFTQMRNRDAELYLVGDSDGEVESILARYPTDRIIRLTNQSRERFAALMSSSDLVCLPSLEDGFNQVAVQAMACGVPVLLSTNTGACELVEEGKTGFLVPVRDAKAIGERLEWAVDHRKELAAYGNAARAKMVSESTWLQYADRRLSEIAAQTATARATGTR